MPASITPVRAPRLYRQCDGMELLLCHNSQFCFTASKGRTQCSRVQQSRVAEPLLLFCC